MTKDQFFDAFGQIDFAFVQAAEKALDGRGAARRLPRRRIARTLLIAAVLISLMTATAYAAGIFGLPGRMIRDPGAAKEEGSLPAETAALLKRLRPIHHRDYISLSGVAGTPEYLAAAEWLAFKGSYADERSAEQLEQGKSYYEWRDLERSFAPDAQTREICRLYQVWDAAMWEKLQEIAGQYQLSLHTERRMIAGDWNPSRDHGQYEDGSFVAWATTVIDGQTCIYEIFMERAGALPCDDMTASCTDAYEEWEYTNAFGQNLSLAMRKESNNEAWLQADYLIFYSGDRVTITIKATYGHPIAEKAADERAFAEQLADTLDFSAVAAAETPEDALAVLKVQWC